MKNNDNNMIYIWRIIFTMLVAWFHFDSIYGITRNLGFINGWYISVEFFFIVSGFLLYFQLKKEKFSSNITYISNRYGNIYPIYFLCFMITFMFKSNGNLKNRVLCLLDSFWELICLQSVGLNKGWNNINPTAWYISTLFICSFFLFFLLQHFEKITVNFYIPLGIMIIYSWFYRTKGNLDFVVEMDSFYINTALMRGIADMGLGILAAKLNIYLRVHAKNLFLWKVASIIGFLFVIIGSFLHGCSNMDFIMAIILVFCVSIAFLPNIKYNIPFFIKYWSKASLAIYLIHEMFRTYIFPQAFGIPETCFIKFILSILYLIFITLAGLVLTIISEYLKKLIRCFQLFILK